MNLRIKLLLLSILAVTSPCLADIFILKDGTRVEGKILHEDAEIYLIEINISKSIKDERLINRSDLLKIEREKPHLSAFKNIEGLYPAPDLLPDSQYEERIAAVWAYLKEFPDSEKRDHAKLMLKTLQAEAEEVSNGGLKIDGEIFTVHQYRANAYDLDARIAISKMRNLIDAGNWLAALREFAAFEQDFSGTESYTAVLPTIRKVITAYRNETATLLESYDAREKARLGGLERMSPQDRANSARAIAEEIASLQQRYENEKSAKFRWPTPHPFHKGSLEDTVRLAEQDLTRLQTESNKQIGDSGQAFRDAWQAVHSGDANTKAEALIKAREAKLPPRYLQMLEAAIAASEN